MISVCFMYNLISVPLFACVPPTLHHIFPVLIRFPCSIPVPAKIIARFSITPFVCLTKFYQLRAGANKSKTPPPFAFYFCCTGICVCILFLARFRCCYCRSHFVTSSPFASPSLFCSPLSVTTLSLVYTEQNALVWFEL